MTIKIRQSALLVLVDNQMRILLQHRDDDTDRCPGQWGLFGGAVKPHETPIQALWREIIEELDYHVNIAFRLFVTNHYDQPTGLIFERHYFFNFYMEDVSLTLGEGQGMGWFSFPEMEKLRLTPQITNVWDILEPTIKQKWDKQN